MNHWTTPHELADYLESLPPRSKARGVLARGKQQRCCLGHLCDMDGRAYRPDQGYPHFAVDPEFELEPDWAQLPHTHWLRKPSSMSRTIMDTLADLNDGTSGFRKVIEHLRSLPNYTNRRVMKTWPRNKETKS